MPASSGPRGLATAVLIGLSLASGAAAAQAPPAPMYPAPPSMPPPPMGPQVAPNPATPAPMGPYAPAPYGAMPYAPYAMTPGGYLPPAYAAVELSRRNSTGMMGAGIALLAGGTLAAVLGSVVYSVGYADKTYDIFGCQGSDFCEPVVNRNTGAMGAGIAMIAIGTVAVAVGIPVMMVGLKRVPNTPDATKAPGAAALVPELSGRGNGVALTWRF